MQTATNPQPAPGSADSGVLRRICEYFDRRKHRFELLGRPRHRRLPRAGWDVRSYRIVSRQAQITVEHYGVAVKQQGPEGILGG